MDYKIGGFRLNDKVKYRGKIYFVQRRQVSLKSVTLIFNDFEGKRIKGKGSCPNYNKVRFIEESRDYRTVLRKVNDENIESINEAVS